jgi:hypothetical protein
MILMPCSREGVSPGETETQRVYLSGSGAEDTVDWEFYCTDGRNSGYWTTIRVPSCWEQEGFGAYNYGVNFYGKPTDPAIPTEKGLYRHRFDVPEEWEDRKVHIVFEASMTDTRVEINGQQAGPVHRGGFYRFRYDITSLLKFGQVNLLEVTVSKESADTSVNLAERRADYWNFGGIFRPVFLEIMPERFIERTAINAGADGQLRADIYLSEGLPAGYSVILQLTDMNGRKAGPEVRVPVPQGADSLTLQAAFKDIKQWTAETPDLYKASITLVMENNPIHQVTQKVGFRTFEIREGDGFYLNGQRILLKGVNRHSFRPASGRTLSPRLNYEDVRLIKEMNMNAVRMSHYPPDPEFLDACDELGLYVLDELGGWHGKYDTGVGRKLVKEVVTRDVNHPSILFWDNGNEGGWNTELDEEFSRWDLQQRPVLHPQQEINGVETMHYRSYGETQEYLRGKYIFFPTEMLHGLYDGGHGAGLYDYWEIMRVHPRCGGGLLWAFADEGVVRTDWNDSIDTDGNHGADGIVGPNLEKEGSFYTIRHVWTPVYISMESLPEDFDGRIHVENRYDFTNLNECFFYWKLAGFYGPSDKKPGHRVLHEGRATAPDVQPHHNGTLELKLPGGWQQADVLYLTAKDPADHEIRTWSWRVGDRAALLPCKQETDAKVKFRKEDKDVIVATGTLELIFDASTGMLRHVQKEGRRISFGNGPQFIAARRGDRALDGSVDPDVPGGVDRVYQQIPFTSKLLDFDIFPEGKNIVVSARYFGPISNVRWTVFPDETIGMDYEYRYDGVVELMGVKFDYPEAEVMSKRWLGEGPYRIWQNRMQGTRLDIWENRYNDPVPAESFTYPEFKGYFSGWSWCSLETREGIIHLANQDKENFLGIYTPRDGKDALLYTLPETGIAVLDVIPAVRNKVNATDLVGPSSRPCHANGPRNGKLYFRFE